MSNSPSSPDKTQFGQALAALNRIGQTLVVIQNLPETLNQIAESARDVLSADIVDLYEYVQARDEFILPPILCGERRSPFVPKVKIYEDDVAVKIVKDGKPQYYPDARDTALLTGKFVVPRSDAPEKRFVIREGVESSVSLPLMAGAETVGVMFVNYRTRQAFGDEQKNLIESFSHLAAIAICNARLFKSEHERRQLYETLQETAHVVNESLSPKEVSERALEQLGRVVEYTSASVQLFNGNHRELLSVRTSRKIPDTPELHRDITDDPLVRQIVQNRQPRVLSDVNAELLWEHLPQTEHIKSWIGVPLIAKGEVIGLLTVDHGKAGYYTAERGEVVAAFASQLAVAMHNSIQAQALTRLSQLSQRLISLSEEHEDFHKLLQEIAESAKEVLRADVIELYEYSQARKTYELPQISVGERRVPFVPKEKIYEDDVVMELIYRAEPSYVEDAQGDTTITRDYTIERKDKPTGRFAVREGIQSTAAIPLKSGDEPVGLMFANYRAPQEFTSEQKELIELFANQAAIAIQNARLYQKLDSQVKERTRQLEDVNQRLEILVSFGQTLTSGLRLKETEIINLIHRQASELMDTKNMYVALYDRQKDEVRFGLIYKDGERINVPSRKAGSGRTEEIIRTKKPIFIRTRDELIAWYKQLGREEYIGDPLASWIGVPMVSEDEVLGVIATYHPTEDNVYDQEDLRILRGIAGQAAIAIDNARLYYEVNAELLAKKSELEMLNSEKDEELQISRQKISRAEQEIVINSFTMDILHRVPNLVGTIPLRADTIARKLKEKWDEDSRAFAIKQAEGIKNDVENLLVSVKTWNPIEEALKQIPEDVGLLLNSALRNTLIPDDVEIETSFEKDMPCVLCNPQALFESFRCVIENGFQAMPKGGKLVVKASSTVEDGQPRLWVTIADNGHGIKPKNLSKVFDLGFTTKKSGWGYGLWRAQAVIQSVGGTIEVKSVVKKGTTFSISLPGQEGGVCHD